MTHQNLRGVHHINTRVYDGANESPVSIRIIQVRDADIFARMTSEPECRGWTDLDPLTVSDARQEIFRLRGELGGGSVFDVGWFGAFMPRIASWPHRIYFSIIEESTENVIGFVAFTSVEVLPQENELEELHRRGEVGIVMDPASRRKGYATEAIRMLVDWGFTRITEKGLGIQSVTFRVKHENQAMKDLLEDKLTILDEQTRVRILGGPGLNGWLDTVKYTIWPAEWVIDSHREIEV